MVVNESRQQDASLSVDNLCSRDRRVSEWDHGCYLFAVYDNSARPRKLSAVKHLHVGHGHHLYGCCWNPSLTNVRKFVILRFKCGNRSTENEHGALGSADKPDIPKAMIHVMRS